jgi:GTP-binding protein
VACGTTVVNAENGLRIRDLIKKGERVRVAKGGRGGAGNHTGKGAKPGALGECFRICFDLKIVADIFLVGTPGAGKSTLLNRLTHARLEENMYPFSTKVPHLGVYEFKDHTQTTLCELPSLMQGSGEGHGLGNHYLKHLERAGLILIVLEPKTDFAPDLDSAYNLIKSEVGLYDKEYLKRPRFCIINKSDLIASASRKKELEKTAKKWKEPVFFISSKTGEGLAELMKAVQGRSYYV